VTENPGRDNGADMAGPDVVEAAGLASNLLNMDFFVGFSITSGSCFVRPPTETRTFPGLPRQ